MDVFLLNLQKIHVYIPLVKISLWSPTYSPGYLVVLIGGHMATESLVILHISCHMIPPQGGSIIFNMRGVHGLDSKQTLKL